MEQKEWAEVGRTTDQLIEQLREWDAKWKSGNFSHDDFIELTTSLTKLHILLEQSREDNDVLRLKAMPYAKYLASEHWQAVRAAALERAEYKCQLCAAETNLNVHHNTYIRRGEERDADVMVLCRSCHARFHGKQE